MHILLTNDDGIYAEGIYAIYETLRKLGKVTVVAPYSQQSSIGHAITLAHPIFYHECKRKGKFFGHGVTGTPADCVKFAIDVVLKKKKPDIVVSGINFGPNEGCSVVYSGTCAGAREGALLGIPSMAVSLAAFIKPSFTHAAQYGAQIAKKLINFRLPKGTFLNLNVPHLKPSQIKGIRITHQGLAPIHGSFYKRRDPKLRDYYWMTGDMPIPKVDDGSDTYALNKGYVTIAPIQSDATNYHYVSELKKFFS